MLAFVLAAVLQPAEVPPAVVAVKPLAAWAGGYTTRKTEFAPDGTAGEVKPGRAAIKVRAGGHVVSIEKQDEEGYDDLLAVQYDEDTKTVRGVMFMPLPKPRAVKATITADKVVFDYDPLRLGDNTIVTRETISRAADGTLTWLVEWKMPDGSYLKRREIVGTRAK